jgi:uncharacterized sporulation protein YeaH/YhbH (DUF444 family)
MSMLIDRRLNDRRKSAVNRQRFMRRYKEQVRRAVDEAVAKRSIRELENGETVGVPVKDITEPVIRHGRGGDREYVLPGNRSYKAGDKIERPRGGAGEGNGEQGGLGDGVDNFAFTLSREEFMQLFLDDLELPRLERNAVGSVRTWRTQPAGFTRSGAPRNLHVLRSLKQSLARRIALRASGGRVPFLDEIDLRYRHRASVPQPVSQAVMFCLMDVSGSMGENKKDLAKRFYLLLYLFLTRKYEKVDLVFIRHTEDAQEVPEEEFFQSQRTGGTVVMSALALMHEIIEKRYPTSQWNIYGAQASDGDAFGADPEKSRGFLEREILPLARHFAYIEVSDSESERASSLWAAYQRLGAKHFAMTRVASRGAIYPVFRELFRKEAK